MNIMDSRLPVKKNIFGNLFQCCCFYFSIYWIILKVRKKLSWKSFLTLWRISDHIHVRKRFENKFHKIFSDKKKFWSKLIVITGHQWNVSNLVTRLFFFFSSWSLAQLSQGFICHLLCPIAEFCQMQIFASFQHFLLHPSMTRKLDELWVIFIWLFLTWKWGEKWPNRMRTRKKNFAELH